MAKQSPLLDLHRAHGAELGEEDGWILPLHFGDPLREYRAVRSGVGILDFCRRSLLRFTGPDRVAFLQGMVSNDVKKLDPGQGIEAAFLNIHGKILADARIFATADSLLVDLPEILKDKILAHLDHYLVADEVEIADLTSRYAEISLQGPEARPLLGEICSSAEIPSRELEHRVLEIGGAEIMVVCATHTGEEGCDLIVKKGDILRVVSRIEEPGKKFSFSWVGTRAQEILRVEAGIPRYGIDMTEEHILLETGLDRAVSFDKGCYLGQETIERIRSRGHVNRKLVGMILAGETPAGRDDAIHSGEKEVGKITSSLISPALKRAIALGHVHRDYFEPGTRLAIEHQGKLIPAEVSPLPFYRPPQRVP